MLPITALKSIFIPNSSTPVNGFTFHAHRRIACLCVRYIDITIHLLTKSDVSSLLPSSIVVQTGLCRVMSGNLRDRFSHDAVQLSFYVLNCTPVFIYSVRLGLVFLVHQQMSL